VGQILGGQGMKGSLSDSVLLKYINNTFFETGTFKGDAVNTAIRCGFKTIYSVEFHRPFYDYCVNLFKHNDIVHLYCGDSAICLWDIIKDIDEKITFWLDGHIEVGIPFGAEPIPILRELEQIDRHHIKEHTIMIDDRRVMGTDVWFGITEKSVISSLLQINHSYSICYEDTCNAPNDILIARL
jgi:hypothetical protein